MPNPQAGDVLLFVGTAKGAFVFRSDATRAYTNQWSGQGDNTNRRVALAQRELVFVRPNFVFMLDRVVSTNPAFQKSWLLHSVESPKVNINGAWFNCFSYVTRCVCSVLTIFAVLPGPYQSCR